MTSTSVGLRSGPLTWLDRQSATLLVVTVAAVAWGVLFYGHLAGGPFDHGAAHGTAEPAHQGHGSHGSHVEAAPSAGGSVLTGSAAWGIMVVAMMLPPALPLFTLLRRLLASRPRRTLLLAGALAVFTVAWTVVGVVLVAADALVGTVAQAWEPRQQVVLGSVLVLAGVYQFTPLKDACLRACRSPRSFALAHWHGQRPGVEAGRLTFAYALTCIGCCWALMAICLVVGAVAMPAMVLLAVVMAAERLVPWGRRLAHGFGVAITATGVAALAGWLPAAAVMG